MIHEKYFKLIIEKKIKYLPTPKLLKKEENKKEKPRTKGSNSKFESIRIGFSSNHRIQ